MTTAESETTNKKSECREIIKIFKAHSQREGAGFIVQRPIGGPYLSDEQADPFLLLDELGPTSYKKGEFEGAPWHPHRGNFNFFLCVFFVYKNVIVCCFLVLFFYFRF